MRIDENLKSTRMPQDGRTGGDVSCDTKPTPKSCPVPELDALFKKMEDGQVPNWLDFISATSAMVAFYTDYDLPSSCSVEKNFCMSQK